MTTERQCERCGYEFASMTAGRLGFVQRQLPDACPECGGDLVEPQSQSEDLTEAERERIQTDPVLELSDFEADGGRVIADGGVSPREWVLEQIDERTTPDPDGEQDGTSNVWTSETRLLAEAVKPKTPVSKDAVGAEIRDLKENNEVVHWCGLLAPDDEEHIKAIIECERRSSIPRKILVGRLNREYLGVGDEEEQVVTDGGVDVVERRDARRRGRRRHERRDRQPRDLRRDDDRRRYEYDEVRSLGRTGQRVDQGPCPHASPGEMPCSLECLAGGATQHV